MGHSNFFTLAAPVRQLTDDLAQHGTPLWSRDGRWIYFWSNRGGSDNIWKMPSAGGKAEQVTKEGCVLPGGCESSDGRFLYCFMLRKEGRQPGLYRVPVSGGPKTLVIEKGGLSFDLTDRGIYFIDGDKSPTIKFYDFATKQAKTIAPLHDDPEFRGGSDPQISPDGKWLFYSGGLYRSEIMLMENFR